MKKIVILLCLLLISSVAFAGDTITHSSKEANFMLQVAPIWDKMNINKVSQEKNPAWQITFESTSANTKAPFALMIVDGRKNADIRQTSEDFAKGQANVMMAQIASAESASTPKDGFVLVESEIRKLGGKSYIWLKSENKVKKAVRYRTMTSFGNYLYAISSEIENAGFAEQKQSEQNLLNIMQTLDSYRKGK